MRKSTAIILSLLLLFFVGLSTLALGLGSQLTPLAEGLHAFAALAAVAGLAAGLLGRARLAQAAFVASALVVVGYEVAGRVQRAERRAEVAPQIVAENEVLLAQAEVRVPCENGDVVTIHSNKRADSGFHSMSLRIIPKDRSQKAHMLVVSTGQWRPPMEDALDAYRVRTGGKCRNAEYASLDAVMGRLRAHHEAEKHKYPQKPDGGR